VSIPDLKSVGFQVQSGYEKINEYPESEIRWISGSKCDPKKTNWRVIEIDEQRSHLSIFLDCFSRIVHKIQERAVTR